MKVRGRNFLLYYLNGFLNTNLEGLIVEKSVFLMKWLWKWVFEVRWRCRRKFLIVFLKWVSENKIGWFDGGEIDLLGEIIIENWVFSENVEAGEEVS